MRQKVTLKQLAAELDLSISTVSKSLKNDPEISQATIDRVRKLAKERNYKPNALAVSLKSNKTRSIGVIIPDILNNFFAKVLLGIENEANKNNYKIITTISNESFEKEKEYLDMFNETLKDDIPIVMFDRVADDVYCDKVIVDDKKGAGDAIDKLIQSGCENIGVVSTIQKLSVGKERLEGLERRLKSYEKETKILKLKKSKEYEEQIANFIKENKFDGIIGLDETAAVSAVNAASILGFKVPKDFSVIGFTNGILSKHSYPKLTSVSQHAKRMGSTAAKILIDKLELRAERYLPETKVIKTSIVERGTTIN